MGCQLNLGLSNQFGVSEKQSIGHSERSEESVEFYIITWLDSSLSLRMTEKGDFQSSQFWVAFVPLSL